MERIKNLQMEVALHRKKNEASYKAALAGSEWILMDFIYLFLRGWKNGIQLVFLTVVLDLLPKKMVLSATVPKEFHFNTNTRSKTTTSTTSDHKEVDFISQLRKATSPVSIVHLYLTGYRLWLLITDPEPV